MTRRACRRGGRSAPRVRRGHLIGLGFLASPAVKALGVSFMGVEMPTMIVTVVVAHLAYGILLGVLLRRWLPADDR